MKIMYYLILMCLCIFTQLNYCGCSCRPGCCGPQNTTTRPVENKTTEKTQKEIIQEAYGKVAMDGESCCVIGGGCCGGGADLSQDIGYSKKELEALAEANLGLGCGNPISLGEIKQGYTVVDLGSGAGLDCFLAAEKVGKDGRVIGIDMTPAMIEKAKKNAEKYGYKNVEFCLGDIENLPVSDNSVDIVLSNCVINLAPDKKKVFQEAYRVLKSGGKMYVSDVVLLGKLSVVQKNDPKLLCACVSGAIHRSNYISILEEVGFTVNIVEEDKEINKKWFGDDTLPIESFKYIACI